MPHPCGHRLSSLRCFIALVMATAAAAALLLLHPRMRPLAESVRDDVSSAVQSAASSLRQRLLDEGGAAAAVDEFARARRLTLARQDVALYGFNYSLRLPLLRLGSPAEADAAWRAREAAAWLRASVDVVFAATVRNAMRGLPTTAEQMRRLAGSFRSASFIFVENDSADGTRKFLADWRRRDPRVRLLGCGGSEAPCRFNVTYSTGRSHQQGWSMKRSDAERMERGVLMSTLRNVYLSYIYGSLAPGPDSLLIVVDADLSFHPWNLSAILQGLHYFRDRPGLQSLCAHTRHIGFVYDPCTLLFYPSQHFSQAAESATVAGFRTTPVTGLPPVKVDSCFQAFTAYRLGHLARRQLMYGPAAGETVCEHNTLARQLEENYLDFNMRIEIRAQNEGGY